ncbi:MAG: viroplasmin family protein [Lachnospiraceae bacterium]
MAKKFYAIRKGNKTGVFTTWEECKKYIHGYSGAEYKSFLTLDEAKQYIDVGAAYEKQVNTRSKGVEAYVDGSYHATTKEFSYGMIILENGQEHMFYKKFQDEELAKMRNVAGEILGARAAMEYALEHGILEISIYYDYEGIAKWCLGDWKTNKDGTKDYKAFYDSIKDRVKVNFVKVKGHSNDKYNDIADGLAKKALGITS